MDELLAAFGIKKIPILVAGAVGGLISLRHYDNLTYKGRLLVVISSIALANYTTHPVVKFFGDSASDYELGIAAAIGLFGLSIVSSLTSVVSDAQYWKTTLQSFLDGWRK